VVSDVSSPALDAVLDAAFGGRPTAVAEVFRRLSREGVTGATVLTLALRHALLLLGARADIEAGRSVSSVVEGWRGLPFRRRAEVGRYLAQWTSVRLRRVVEGLQHAVLDTRKHADLAEALTIRVLLRIAAQAGAPR